MNKVKFFAPDTDAYVDSVVRHAAEFTQDTGIELDIQIIPTDEYFSNDIHKYLQGDNCADVFMSGPVLLWEHIGAGFVEPLDQYWQKASDGFDGDDFFAPLIASNRWTGKFGDKLGEGSLWEIPVNCEAYNLAYVPAILEKYDVAVPNTWQEYFHAAEEIQSKSNGAVRGFGQRGLQVWHTMYTGYATQFWAYGATDFDDQGKCAIASPEGIAATTDFIEALRKCGPKDLMEQRWYELAMDFGDEQYGLIVDSDHYVAFFEDETKSNINGRVGYAMPPAGIDGKRQSNLWTWSVVMNAKSQNKQAAWQFIEWAAGKNFLNRATFEGNMNPTRQSIWNDEKFIEFSSGWGNFYDVAHQLLKSDARVVVTPSSNYINIADRWVRALREAYIGDKSVQQALEDAAADIDKINS